MEIILEAEGIWGGFLIVGVFSLRMRIHYKGSRNTLVHVEVALQNTLLEGIWLSPLRLLGLDGRCLRRRRLHLDCRSGTLHGRGNEVGTGGGGAKAARKRERRPLAGN